MRVISRMPSTRARHTGSPFVLFPPRPVSCCCRSSSSREGAHEVIHVRRAREVRAGVIRPLHPIDGSAVLARVRAVKVALVGGRQSEAVGPLVRAHRPPRIRRVARVAREPRGQLEEAAVGDGVLVAVPVVEGVDLPAQAAAAARGVPAQRLRVEDGLRERQPVRFAARRVWEVLLGCGNHAEAPETLVVVALGCVSWAGRTQTDADRRRRTSDLD